MLWDSCLSLTYRATGRWWYKAKALSILLQSRPMHFFLFKKLDSFTVCHKKSLVKQEFKIKGLGAYLVVLYAHYMQFFMHDLHSNVVCIWLHILRTLEKLFWHSQPLRLASSIRFYAFSSHINYSKDNIIL